MSSHDYLLNIDVNRVAFLISKVRNRSSLVLNISQDSDRISCDSNQLSWRSETNNVIQPELLKRIQIMS